MTVEFLDLPDKELLRRLVALAYDDSRGRKPKGQPTVQRVAPETL